jgi:hypothetical protein
VTDSRHDLWARNGELDLVEDPDIDLHVHRRRRSAYQPERFLVKGAVDERTPFSPAATTGAVAIMRMP